MESCIQLEESPTRVRLLSLTCITVKIVAGMEFPPCGLYFFAYTLLLFSSPSTFTMVKTSNIHFST